MLGGLGREATSQGVGVLSGRDRQRAASIVGGVIYADFVLKDVPRG